MFNTIVRLKNCRNIIQRPDFKINNHSIVDVTMSSSYLPSKTSATHRKSSQTSDNPTTTRPNHVPEVAPAPNPRPIFQFIAFGLVVILGLIQFLPATHFRDPSDPFRNWVPIRSESSSSIGSSSDGNSGNGQRGDDGMVHVVSWMDCLDLRVLAVLANSTLSSSSHPDLVFFHFFIPGGKEDKVSFYKLKVLFPHSNLEIHGQEEIKEIIGTAYSGLQHASPGIEEIVPFIIPRVSPFLIKFIYVSASVIMKGNVEELIGVDLLNYAIAAAEDCSERLKDYVNFDVLHAIQRMASKPWVSETPFPKDACMPDLTLLLIDARKLQKYILESIVWWSKVLNLDERNSQKNPAVTLALHNKYIKLSSSWLVKESSASEINTSMVIHYDGPKTVCFESSSGTSRGAHGNAWGHYLPLMSDRILGN